MPRAIVLQHAPHEDAGVIATRLSARGVVVEHRLLHRGEPVPAADACGDLLVVMGGSMGVGDRGDSRYPFLEHELSLLRELIARQHPVLGICLGAQLIAHAAGAAAYPNHGTLRGRAIAIVREVGLGPVDFPDRGEAALAGLRDREIMLHWHDDTFDLPAGAIHLASTPLCPNQAFRLGRRIYALQFHCEVDRAGIADWVREDAEFVALAHGPSGRERILADVERWYDEHRIAADRLLGNILTEMGV
ncbi:MAG: gamma-glutamyl-gamma-aminobutyrate hydrolase family protein [Planctomycetes bacterium]|nr:gamma-glutamyl-gamma-aminobutyrate hydrolase family protein [Planctomycetota bacterium]